MIPQGLEIKTLNPKIKQPEWSITYMQKWVIRPNGNGKSRTVVNLLVWKKEKEKEGN